MLLVVCSHTHFGSEARIASKIPQDLCFAFLNSWSTVYVNHINRIKSHLEASWNSDLLRSLAELNGIDLQLSLVGAQNTIGTEEQYHSPLRRICLAIRESYQHLGEKLALCLPIKALNDTKGPEGLVPTLLIFGVIPSLPVINKPLP